MQAAYLAMAQRHHWPASQIAVVHVNDDYGRGLLRVLRPLLDSVVFEGLYADGGDSADVERLGDGILAAAPDLLVWLGRPETLGVLLPPLRRALPDITVVCADACDVASVYANGNGRFNDLYFVRFMDPAAPDSAIAEFQTRYREQTGEVASSEALLTYDAVSLVRAALSDGARTRGEVRKYLESLGSTRPAFEGITGRIEFDPSGTFVRRYMLAKVHADGVRHAEHASYRYEE
jgi:ABC-type branched-subunit amino acid transport system substrate-binding protein